MFKLALRQFIGARKRHDITLLLNDRGHLLVLRHTEAQMYHVPFSLEPHELWKVETLNFRDGFKRLVKLIDPRLLDGVFNQDISELRSWHIVWQKSIDIRDDGVRLLWVHFLWSYWDLVVSYWLNAFLICFRFLNKYLRLVK